MAAAAFLRLRPHKRAATLTARLLLLTAALLLSALPHTHALASTAGREGSSFLSSLRSYEVVSIDSPHLSEHHPMSISSGGASGPAAKQTGARRFARHLSLSFRSQRHAHRVMSADGAVNSEPKVFDLQLSKMVDLFHPSYSQARQAWREGKRVEEQDSVRTLSEVENCYYRARTPTTTHYASLSTCQGGFSGFIRERETVWLLEPAHKHLQAAQMQKHLLVLRAAHSNHTSARAHSTLSRASHNTQDEIQASHLHLLYRAEDVDDLPEFMCSVGLSEEEAAELARTGKMPKKKQGMHTQAHHSHDHAHDHAHDHSHAHHLPANSAYSTWLAAMNPQTFNSDALRDALEQQQPSKEALLVSDGKLRHGGAHFSVHNSSEADADRGMPLRLNPYAEHGWDLTTINDPHSPYQQSRAESRLMRPAAVGSFKYVELLVVNDNLRYTQLGDDTEQSTARIAAHMKTTYEATTAFDPLITIVLIGQITWREQDPYTVQRGKCAACQTNNGVSVDELLREWNKWRSNVQNLYVAGRTTPYRHDNGHLFSGYPFEVPTLGYAGVGAMCTPAISGGINHISSSQTEAGDFYNSIVAAHEMGHNFGMNHDSVNNACPQSGFIMNAVLASPTPTVFSSCSVNYQQGWFAASHASCLDNVPTERYGDAVCGNGFKEAGEDCDCGNAQTCQFEGSRDPCCNAATCKFIEGATCSATQGCCENCQVVRRSAEKVCRPSANSCDLPETCTGESADCPADVGLASGTTCSAGQYGPGLCYLNSCLSYLQQCRTAGANFPDAPYDTCVQQSQLNQGQYCSTLWCSSEPGSCTFFRQQGVVVSMADGVPCPDPDRALKWQCRGGQCVNPNVLNVNYEWKASGWSSCDACDQMQSQNVTCMDKATNATVLNDLCPPSTKPPVEQLCINEAIGCRGAQGRDPNIVDIFGYIQFERQTLIFATLGVCTGILVIMGCCYQAVTFQGEADQLPGPKSEGEKNINGDPAPTDADPAATDSHKKKRSNKKKKETVNFEGTQADLDGAIMASAKASGKSSRKKKKKDKDDPSPVLLV